MDLTITAQTGRAFVPPLRRQLKKAIALIPNAPEEISVALVDDATMSLLHERDLGIAGPTDVLTYELDHDTKAGRCTSGEVIVCVPEAKRQAAERRGSVGDELLLYALHGALHLAGFDDRTDRCYREMHRMEDDILSQIGVGPVFRPVATKNAPPARRKTRRPHRQTGAR